MATASISDVLKLIGDPLTDTNDAAKERFREYVSQAKWSTEEYGAWLAECTDKGGRDADARTYYNALQDIVVGLGARLGLEIEYGRYSGSQKEPSPDGLWRRPSGEVIVVEVKTSPWPVDKVRQLGDYLAELAQKHDWEIANVYGLYAIGSGDFESLLTQIRGSDWRNQIRLVSFDRLLSLIELAEQWDAIGGPGSGATKAQRLLLPVETIDLGVMIDLIMEIAELGRQEAGEDTEDDEADETTGDVWSAAELEAYLRDATANQKALLGALCSVDEGERVSRKRLLHLMGIVAESIPELRDYEITGYTIAGSRAGLKMRRGGKEDIIDAARGKYRLRPDYRETVAAWAASESLWVTDDHGTM